MITIKNYFQKKEKINWASVPEKFKAGLEDTELLISEANEIPETLEIPEIKEVIEIFLAEINKQFSTKNKKAKIVKKSTRKAVAKKVVKPEKKLAEYISTKDRIVKTKRFKELVPKHQLNTLLDYDDTTSEKIINSVEKQLLEIPTKPQGESLEKSIVHAHYFIGNTHWYVLDMQPNENTIFGYVILNGDTQMAEAGYTRIEDLVNFTPDKNNYLKGLIEMDFYFTKNTLENVLAKQYPNVYKKQKNNSKNPANKKIKKKISDAVDVKIVEHYTTEYRLIRRFYNLINRNETASFRKIQLIYMAFQKAALDRSIRKSSSAADLFTKINKKIIKLFELVEPGKDDANIDFKDKVLFKELEIYVKEKKINYAVSLLKSFIGLQGYKPEERKVKNLLKRIDNAFKNKRVSVSNRLYDDIKSAKKALQDYLNDTSEIIQPTQVGLSLPVRSICTNRIKCTGLRKDGKLKRGFKFVDGGKVASVKKKAG